MLQYLVRKLLLAVPLVLGVMTLIFFLLELTPGDISDRFCTTEMPPDVCDAVVEKFKLNEPMYMRYLSMMGNLLRGEFGVSLQNEQPVFDNVMQALPNTLQLSLVTLTVVFSVGVLMGTVQAVRQYSFVDNALSVGSLFFYSMPRFWLALVLMLVFSLHLDLLPAAEMKDPIEYDFMTPGEKFVDRLQHILLPGIALGLASAAGTARYMRSSDARGHSPRLHPHRAGQGPAGAHGGLQARHAERAHPHRDAAGVVPALPVQRLGAGGVHLRVAGHGAAHHRGHPRPGHPGHHRLLLRVHPDGGDRQPARRHPLLHR